MMENSGASSLFPSPVYLNRDSHKNPGGGGLSHKREGVWVPVSPHGGEQPSIQKHLPELLMNEKQTSVEFVPFYILAYLYSCSLIYLNYKVDQITRVPWLISEETGTEPLCLAQEPLLDCIIFSNEKKPVLSSPPLVPSQCDFKELSSKETHKSICLRPCCTCVFM